jgi:hypothetical protein
MKPYSNMDTREVESRVMSKIARFRLRRARIAAACHGILGLGTLLAFVPTIEYTSARAVESGFPQYLSLLASDWKNLAGSWSSFFLSLVESAPLLGGIMSLMLIVVFIYVSRKSLGNISSLRRGSYQNYQPAV